MGCLGRAFGLLLILLILMVTPCAFWAFNIDRVALSPQTYKTALRSQNFYRTLLPTLVDGAATMGTDNGENAQVHEAAQSLAQNVRPEEWELISEKLLPPSWLQEQVDGNIDRLFSWIQGTSANLDIHFDLTILKSKLSNKDDVSQAVQIILPRLQPCTKTEEDLLASGKIVTNSDLPILCKPASESMQQTVSTTLTTVFTLLGTEMPAEWRLNDHLKSANGPMITYTDDNGDTHTRPMNDNDLNHFRAFVWLDSRLIVLLFLIPIAMFALVIMVAIRSSKQFFRWLGWGLILSGILTLAPVPFVTPALFGGLTSPNSREAAVEGGMIVSSLVAGMVTSVTSGMTLAVLTQVAIAIGLGFVAVFISVLVKAPEPDVTHRELAMERAAMSNAGMSNAALGEITGGAMGYQPYQQSYGSTPRPAGSTPMPNYTPPPSPSSPPSDATLIDDPLSDLFK